MNDEVDNTLGVRKASTMRYKGPSKPPQKNNLFGDATSKDDMDVFDKNSSRRMRNQALKVSEIKEVEFSEECETP
jgi:hypothetical protein